MKNINMSKNKLEITIDLEDHTAGLFGSIKTDVFRGFGEGWFNLIDIEAFITDASKMISSLKSKANMVAGQNSRDGSEYLERFGLRCYPIGSTGVIGVHVTLTDYPYTDCRAEEVFKVSGEIKTNIEKFNTFLSELSELIKNKREKVILIGEN